MKRLVSTLAGMAILGVATNAGAYLLSSWAVLRKLETKRAEAGVMTLVVSGQLTVAGAQGKALAAALKLPTEGDQVTVPAQVSYRAPGRCRVDVTAPGVAEGARPYALSKNGALAGSPELLPVQHLLSLACPLLSSGGGETGSKALTEWMHALGVDTQSTSLSRFGRGVVAEVLGAEARDFSVAQVWVDKDNFVPVRVIAKVGAAMLDARLLDVGAAGSGSEVMPRAMELWQLTGTDGQGTLLARFEGDHAEPNTKVPETLWP
jgi:hypothetical protein